MFFDILEHCGPVKGKACAGDASPLPCRAAGEGLADPTVRFARKTATRPWSPLRVVRQ